MIEHSRTIIDYDFRIARDFRSIKNKVFESKRNKILALLTFTAAILFLIALFFIVPLTKDYIKALEIKKDTKDLQSSIEKTSADIKELSQVRKTSPFKNKTQGYFIEERSFRLIPIVSAQNSTSISDINSFLNQANKTKELSDEIVNEVESIRERTIRLQRNIQNPNAYLDENLYAEVVRGIEESEDEINATYEIAYFYSEYSKASALFATGVGKIEIELSKKRDASSYVEEAQNQILDANKILESINNDKNLPQELKDLSSQTQQTYSNLSNALTGLTNISKNNPTTQAQYLDQRIVVQLAFDYNEWKDIESQFLDQEAISRFDSKASEILQKINQANEESPKGLEVVFRVIRREESVQIFPKSDQSLTPTPTSIELDDLGIRISNLRSNFSLKPGESKQALTITSTGASGISMYGYPTSYGPGINWSISSAGLTKGRSIDISIEAINTVPPGTYKGKAIVISYPSNKKQVIGDIEVIVANDSSVGIPTPTPTLTSGSASVQTPTPTSSQNPGMSPGASLSTNSVNITMNRGETKNNVFSFTSTGATGFSLYGYPTSIGSGIVASPATGGFSNGQTINVSLTVNSSVSPGTYTGSQTLTFTPYNAQKTVSYSITVVEPSSSSLGYTFSANSVNVTIQKGNAASVFTFTSTGSTQYHFQGPPTDYGPGINWLYSSGGTNNGQATEQKISVNSNVSAGTYTGTAVFTDDTSGAHKNIPVSVTVTD